MGTKENIDDWVYCIKCPEKGRVGNEIGRCSKKEVETSQWYNWTCHKCRTELIGLQLIDFIKTRISVTATEDDDRSKFIFRELLQNADDVSSKILVLRFEEDALYVANDGRAFTTTSIGKDLSDFDKISRILGRHQAEDKETVGHFGSGFQTVYAITNKPEVHSNGISGQMNPVTKKWNYSIHKRTSPYIAQSCKGVLFRFPWRDNAKAKEVIDGICAFEDSNYWPRWNKKERRNFFNDLIDYIHQALLCCRNLTTIRLIWHEGKEYEGYQVTRNFALRIDNPKSTDPTTNIGLIEQGFIEPKDWKDEWVESFQVNGWKWGSNKSSNSYFIGSMNVINDAGRRLHFGKKPDGQIKITSHFEDLTTELKHGDVHVMLPLFDASLLFKGGDGRAFLYSVIPLPKKSKNMFTFSAHFFPTEDRKDVDVEGYGGTTRIWYEQVMKNVGNLYLNIFSDYLEHLNSLGIPEKSKQEILLNNIPLVPLHEWMRPGREQDPEWSKDLSNRIINTIIHLSILFSNGEWLSPKQAYWPKDENEHSVIRILGGKTFTSEFMGHHHFSSIHENLESQKVNIDHFNNLWEKFELENSDEEFNLVYKQKLAEKNILDKKAVMNLIQYCITRKDALHGTIDKAIVPGKDGILRPLRKYPTLDEKLEFMYEIMSEEMLVHDDFSLILKEKRDEQNPANCDDVINIVNQLVNSDQVHYENMSENKHRIVSKILRILIVDMGFVLKENHRNLRFIPYKQGNCKSIGTPNTRSDGDNLVLIQGKHAGENYQRDSIFGVQKLEVRGLTKEVKSRIKFLSLLDCDNIALEKIEDVLSLEKLMERPKTPVNFVRHFLSMRHGSLFEDYNLSKFLETDDEKLIKEQKVVFHEALKVYFDTKHVETYLNPEDMKKVPCLYDAQEKWHKAGDFALKMYPELELIGYKSLHEELNTWRRETLMALGVAESPEISKIISTIRKLVREEENGINNRRNLTNILLWLLTSDVPLSEDFNHLKNIKWIPTRDKYYKTPKSVLIPSQKNKEIMGRNFEDFLDYSECSDVIAKNAKKRMKGENIDDKRLAILGLKSEPDFSDMIQIIIQYRQKGLPPPAKLFDVLSSTIRDEKINVYCKKNESYGYYYKEKWIDSTLIRILDETTIPEELQDMLIIFPPKTKHSEYLFYDGAKSFIDPEDILKPLAAGNISPSLILWDTLRSIGSRIEEKHRRTYEKCAIYPLNGKLLSPKNIILNEHGTEELEGDFGQYFIIGPELSKRHPKALKKLGARSLSELEVYDVFELIQSLKNKNEYLEPNLANLVVFLIKRITELNPKAQFPNEELWPAEKSGKFVWVKPKNSFLKDSQIADYFKDDLPFLHIEIKGKQDESLQKFALECGCENFSEKLKKYGLPSVSCPVLDRDLMAVLKEMAYALEKNYMVTTHSSSCFEWLKQIEVNRCDEVVITYAIGNLRKEIEKFALVENVDSTEKVIVQYGNVMLFDELTDEILKKCTEKGLPKKVKDPEELRFLVYKLLTHHPVFWHDLINGYEYSGETLIPEISPQEGGKGYLETRETLQTWYGCCQICGSQTPKDANGFETLEQVKSVVTTRGGRYHGYREGYSTDNCILLCPRHQKLFERGLVKFLDFEQVDKKEILQNIDKIVGDFQKTNEENPNKYEKIWVEVFEGKGDFKSESSFKGGVRSKWEKCKITFTIQHLLGLLENMRVYFKDKK